MSEQKTKDSIPVEVSRILAPTDFSHGAEPALRWATTLAQSFGAELVLLHVLDLYVLNVEMLPGASPLPATVEVLERMRQDATAEMARLAAEHRGARTILREGSPRSTILQVAEEIEADLIVMGTHGRTGLAHAFFGSVAEHVVRSSRIPVLTVRQEKD